MKKATLATTRSTRSSGFSRDAAAMRQQHYAAQCPNCSQRVRIVASPRNIRKLTASMIVVKKIVAAVAGSAPTRSSSGVRSAASMMASWSSCPRWARACRRAHAHLPAHAHVQVHVQAHVQAHARAQRDPHRRSDRAQEGRRLHPPRCRARCRQPPWFDRVRQRNT